MSLYTRSFLDLMQIGQECVANEYLNEFHESRLRAAETLNQKYTMLSKEYQAQSNEFKRKHEEIKADEE